MIKGWTAFLESVNDDGGSFEKDFKEICTILEKEIDHLNLVKDLILGYEGEYEFSYEFHNELFFAYLSVSPSDRPLYDWQEIYITEKNGDICINGEYDNDLNYIKKALDSKECRMVYTIKIFPQSSKYGDEDWDYTPNDHNRHKIYIDKIISEMKSQYPFVKLVSQMYSNDPHEESWWINLKFELYIRDLK